MHIVSMKLKPTLGLTFIRNRYMIYDVTINPSIRVSITLLFTRQFNFICANTTKTSNCKKTGYIYILFYDASELPL